jgi:hypothetical protein
MVLLKYSQIDESVINKLVFKRDDRGNIKIFYTGEGSRGQKDKLQIQLTSMESPFGISRNAETNRILPFSFAFRAKQTKDDNKNKLYEKNMNLTRKAINMLEQKCREELSKNSVEWMEEEDLDEDDFDMMYKSPISEYVDPVTNEPNGKYPDKLKVEFRDFSYEDKITGEEKKIQTGFFDYKTHEILDSDECMATGSLKKRYMKPIVVLDELSIKRKEGNVGEAIRPKYYVNDVKLFPSSLNDGGDAVNRFNHVSDSDSD